MKLMREEMKQARKKYGPIAKRNIATRAAFWNYLVDSVRVTDPDVSAILTGHAKAAFTRGGPWYRYGDGALGRATTYDEYKGYDGKEKRR